MARVCKGSGRVNHDCEAKHGYRSEMREQLAQWLSMSGKYGNFLVWDRLGEATQDDYRARADRLLPLIREEIEKVENPSLENGLSDFHSRGFEHCRYAILALFKEK